MGRYCYFDYHSFQWKWEEQPAGFDFLTERGLAVVDETERLNEDGTPYAGMYGTSWEFKMTLNEEAFIHYVSGEPYPLPDFDTYDNNDDEIERMLDDIDEAIAENDDEDDIDEDEARRRSNFKLACALWLLWRMADDEEPIISGYFESSAGYA